MTNNVTYKVGQILTAAQNIELKRAISEEKVVIPKGSKIIIGADKLAHHIRDGSIQQIADAEIKGYDTEGLAEYLVMFLKTHFPIVEMLEDYDIDEQIFKEEIEYALDEIGF